VFRTASENPARVLGIDSRTGSLEEGKDADLVLLGPELDVRMTLVQGTVVYDAGANRAG
jgi:N-acetylglucosamine-6-phosphate deacetylase